MDRGRDRLRVYGDALVDVIQEALMMMSQQDRNKRRALIVRRWSAYRIGRAQREIWRRKRREEQPDDDEVVGDTDLLAELPDGLVG